MRYFCRLFQGIPNPESISLIGASDSKVQQLTASRHRLQASEEEAIDRLSQKQHCCRFLFCALLAGGTFVGAGFLSDTISYYKSLAAQEVLNFDNLLINNSTCHSLYPKIRDLEDCCSWSNSFSCLGIKTIDFCSNIISTYCDYEGTASSRILGAVLISIVGVALGGVSVYFLNCFLKKERSHDIDYKEVTNEALSSEDRTFLRSQGIFHDNSMVSDVINGIINREIVLTLGVERRDLYNIFGTHIKDYIADSGDGSDAYHFCSGFPRN